MAEQQHTVRILMTGFVTHNVKRFVIERPDGYDFSPGQATEMALPDAADDGHPFTFTSLTDDRVLEFTIKGYFDHDGMTKKLHSKGPGDELLIGDSWGAITYRGPGVFIAGGAGVTPFIAILRRLRAEGKADGHRLLFSNHSSADVICEKEFRDMLGDDFVSTLTREEAPGHLHGRINADFLKEHVDDFSQNFYVCGPDPFVADINDALKDLGAKPDSLVFEE
ncbi:MAG: flavodoxin reductase [Phycisphaerae bacterium]